MEREGEAMIYYSALFIIMIIGTIINIFTMPRLASYQLNKNKVDPLVSILIPMRNEERNVKSIIRSLKGLTYQPIEVIILDDQSTDQTRQLLEQEIQCDKRFSVIEGKPLEEGWVGKVHACHQLSKRASGDYYLFIDADVVLEKDTIQHVLALAKKKKAKLVTGFPRFPVKKRMESLLVPLQHVVVFSYLPIIIANGGKYPAATAAHGAFMFFEREAYESIGGHEAVKSSLVEDVHIARALKEKGEKVILANVTSHVNCYMYEKDDEVWNGFAKNVYTGLGRSLNKLVALMVFFIVYYVLPVPLFLYGIVSEQVLLLLPLLLLFLQRLLIDLAAKQKWYLFITMPISAITLLFLMNHSMKQSVQHKGYQWKGRHYK
ncbi:glycosyltransferase family 2 protein [Bacillus sp. 1780r2a1]|nr:glycosyltransferase family 2 protein [Bacillus sp. 1780r2a1]